MNCENYSELITGYVDGELMDAEVALLTKHLNECTRCYKSLEDIHEIKDLLNQYAAMKTLPPSLRFSQKVMRSVQRGIPGSRKKIFGWTATRPPTTWAIAAMVVVVLLAGILYFWMGAQKSSESIQYATPLYPPTNDSENIDFDHIEDYVYQHAMEVSRAPLTDNMVFVGYLDR